MDKKKLITLILCILIVTLIALILINRANIITHYTCDAEGYSFTFKGSFNSVKRVIIKSEGSDKLSLPFEASKDLFEENDFNVSFKDINNDGAKDILIPCLYEEDGDILFSIFTAKNGSFVYSEALRALPFKSCSEGIIYSEYTHKEIISEAAENTPEDYELTHAIERHVLTGDKFITLERRAIIYYSESDYYCYSIYTYDIEYDELTYSDEKWFSSEELDKYPLNWD